MDERLECKTKTIKLVEENIGSKLFDIGLSSIFFFFGPVSAGKGKKKQLHQTQQFLHSEENDQQNKRQPN